MGPVQVPVGNSSFVKAHPDWLRIRPNGKPDPEPNFANIRSGYSAWLLEQLAYVTREFKVDGFWFDGYAPLHLHTYDEATKEAFKKFSGGKDIPLPLSDVPNRSMTFDPTKDPLVRQYLAWHEDHFVANFADRMRSYPKREPGGCDLCQPLGEPNVVLPGCVHGRIPNPLLRRRGHIIGGTVPGDVPGDPLYQQFVYAFMQGVTQEAWRIRLDSTIEAHAASPVFRRRSKSNSVDWKDCPGEWYLNLSNRSRSRGVFQATARGKHEGTGTVWLMKSRAISHIGIVASEQIRALSQRARCIALVFLAHFAH